MTTGYVGKLETFATLDGGGIRVAVFMQGCPLRCAYCHNPDMQAPLTAPDEVCRKVLSDGEAVFSSPSRGGKPRTVTLYTPARLAEKILRFRSYIKKGGVTFTGGEPLLQADFLTETINILKNNDINVALDTSCCLLTDSAKKLALLCDEILADLKFPSDADYLKYSGGSLETVRLFLLFLRSAEKKFTLRTVIVPGINDKPEQLEKYLLFIKQNGLAENIIRYELLPFHTLGFAKYDDFGVENPFKNVPPLGETALRNLQKLVSSSLFPR